MIDQAAEMLPPELDSTRAWTVREGETNVIRHSRAKQCLIRITSQDAIIRAEVINDGYQESGNDLNGKGSGLSGLAERLAGL